MQAKNIVIVGGGTAGWMCANLFAQRWAKTGTMITLIESDAIATVGVGEGSTPFLRDFFNTLNIAESQWMPACDATYKCGIAFPQWCESPAPNSYFHPFYSEIDSPVVQDFFTHCNQRRQGFDTPCHPDDYFVTAYLAAQNRCPIPLQKQSLGVDYGYHFDAEKLGQFLREHGQKIGVKRIEDKVLCVDVCADSSGADNGSQRIAGLTLQKVGYLAADFFVDCTGFRGLLIQQALGESMLDYSSYLPNDRAVALASEHPNTDCIPSYTLSKGLDHGWMWSIPLQSRVGNGYVYSSDYLDAEQAENALRQEIGLQKDHQQGQALHLSWTPGRINQHWKSNCLAVGLSQGFLEPLEAPMLNLVQQTCEAFIEQIESGKPTAQAQTQFNQLINTLIDGTRDYLQAHYTLNSRTDTDYWCDNRNNKHISETLLAIIDGWQSEGSFDAVLAQHSRHLAYMKTSWYCLLAGMGVFSQAKKPGLRLMNKKHQRAQQHCQKLSERFAVQSEFFNQQRKFG